MGARAFAFVRVCMRVCMRACVHAGVSACVWWVVDVGEGGAVRKRRGDHR